MRACAAVSPLLSRRGAGGSGKGGRGRGAGGTAVERGEEVGANVLGMLRQRPARDAAVQREVLPGRGQRLLLGKDLCGTTCGAAWGSRSVAVEHMTRGTGSRSEIGDRDTGKNGSKVPTDHKLRSLPL